MKREKISADAFLCALVYEFPGLMYDREVNGADLVEWFTANLHELKKNVALNMQREACISIGEKTSLGGGK